VVSRTAPILLSSQRGTGYFVPNAAAPICRPAAAALVSGVFILQHGPNSDYRWVVYVASPGTAFLFWLIGRACKYFLAGE
jgi:hypothetical protein